MRRGLLASAVGFWLVLALSEAESLEVDYDGSSIEIHGKAAGFFPATFRFETFVAELEFSGSDHNHLAAASIDFRYDEITSGSKSKDRKVRGWLEADTYPQGNFTASRVVSEDGPAIMEGQLMLHGVSHPARFHYDIEKVGSTVRFRAHATIDYRDWGLPDLRVYAFKINHDLEIVIDLSGDLARPKSVTKAAQ